MAQVFVNNYQEATTILTNRDFAQSLYDDSSIIMKDVILTSDGDSHINRRKTEFHLFRKEISRNYEQVNFPKILKPIIDDSFAKGSTDLVELGYLVTIWQVTQIPFTIGHPSISVQISSSIRTLLGGLSSLII